MGVSCSEPKSHSEIEDIYQSLSDQKHFYYHVEFSITKPGDKHSNSNMYGLVALNRNLDSGISSAYFGLEDGYLPHYLHSIYLNNEWIYELSSNNFDHKDADLIVDTLHSPILVNPQLLFKIEEDSAHITHKKISEEDTKWTFDMEENVDQLVLIWNEKLNRITELEYKYNVNSKDTYSKKWGFKYLAKSEYDKSKIKYKNQNQTIQQPFL